MSVKNESDQSKNTAPKAEQKAAKPAEATVTLLKQAPKPEATATQTLGGAPKPEEPKLPTQREAVFKAVTSALAGREVEVTPGQPVAQEITDDLRDLIQQDLSEGFTKGRIALKAT